MKTQLLGCKSMAAPKHDGCIQSVLTYKGLPALKKRATMQKQTWSSSLTALMGIVGSLPDHLDFDSQFSLVSPSCMIGGAWPKQGFLLTIIPSTSFRITSTMLLIPPRGCQQYDCKETEEACHPYADPQDNLACSLSAVHLQ